MFNLGIEPAIFNHAPPHQTKSLSEHHLPTIQARQHPSTTKMHFNILLTLSTLTALSSNVAAQFPLSGINGLGALGGLDVSSQTPGPSSTPIPTFLTKQATPSAFPSRAPSFSIPLPSASASPVLKPSLPLGGMFGGF
ncbi:hypothetical protein PENCOP_c001G07569 [Penicillium coprophilum]|uniref:Uncharacterized protein n=1 Tax=Penicillium coprophilum TaxID=36646 RepID=A0A1V6VA05_9EURO|nr:hypothetical protein PENCOP_c001G07569 [Penicillium coprophilum]